MVIVVLSVLDNGRCLQCTDPDDYFVKANQQMVHLYARYHDKFQPNVVSIIIFIICLGFALIHRSGTRCTVHCPMSPAYYAFHMELRSACGYGQAYFVF